VNNILKQLFYVTIFVSCILNVSAQKNEKFKIISNEFKIDKKINPDLIRFVGEVVVTHKQMKLFCDSVYQYEKANYIEAFGDVHIIQADTIDVYGDYLHYSGENQFAKLRDNVILKDPKIIVKTDSLNFDMKNNISYYFKGGEIQNDNNFLKSIIGRYYINDNLFFFKDSVFATNKTYVLTSDTLKYNTVSGISTILGPTKIVNETETLYSENGHYNTLSNKAYLTQNTSISRNEYKVFGDSIYTDNNKQIAELYNDVRMRDTVNNILLKGNYLEVFKHCEIANMRDSAVLIQVENADSLFMHAKKFKLDKDSLGNRIIYAYDKVRFFRNDIQGQCDSLVYSLKDSIMRLYTEPIIWAQGNQITADTINILTENKKLKFMDFIGSAYMCSKEDTVFFNQVKGRSMRAFMKNNSLNKLDVKGNAETLYYPKDENIIIGMNVVKSSKLTIKFKDKKIDDILFMGKPDGNMFPLFQIKPEMLYLKNFIWYDELRPLKSSDVFIWKNIVEKENKKKGL